MMNDYSYLSHADTKYIDDLYQRYQQNPAGVDASWKCFFEGYELARSRDGDAPAAKDEKEIKMAALIHAYRSRGHLVANTNPVRKRREHHPKLALSDFGLSEADKALPFEASDLLGMERKKTGKEIVEQLQRIYTGSVGFEYMHIRDTEVLSWFTERCERAFLPYKPSLEEKTHILRKLNEAVVFENFLHTKYVGQKRFSLEGGESTIPALDAVLRMGLLLGVEEVVIGMAHRGRLNVLANIMKKTYEQIFSEFEGNLYVDEAMGDGDVKYHMGYTSQIATPDGKTLNVRLAPNPSHLEAVDAVVEGFARARIDGAYKARKKVLPVLIHGDAAIAGQGIVYELLQMSQLPGYAAGGTLHFIINNQIGFTTDYHEARSSIYCTDVAKIVDVPILHVNGDDVEAVVFCIETAMAFRQTFSRDVFIDMVCYRRYGHNESDEPKFTQPKLYQVIAKHPNPREIYHQRLMVREEADAQLAKDLDREFRDLLQDRLNMVRQKPLPYSLSPMEKAWQSLRCSKPEDFKTPVISSVKPAVMEKVFKALLTLPKGFVPIPQIKKVVEQRHKMFYEQKTLNWASAELLAYGTLLLEDKWVRLSGQDSKRGTFSHRHAVVRDAKTNEPYSVLNHIVGANKRFDICNSLLSEYGVLGFEFGYAMANPDALVVWEAQFGDFANGAQVIIDQFITSSYTKWHQMNGIVLLLPHGYEGQGPEHSSARLERFLQTSFGYNMFVCNPTEPANFFHLLRRQLLLPFRMPCVVMSPKLLFRHPKAVSPLSAFTQGGFQEVIPDKTVKTALVKRVLLCSGKVYYDLLEAREQCGDKATAIVRLEQLHPFPKQQLREVLSRYKGARRYWVQEEPENMGAYTYVLRFFSRGDLKVIARRGAASPATGHYKKHLEEREQLLSSVFAQKVLATG